MTFLPLLTASSAESQLAGPSTASQEAAGPSHSSPAPDDSRSASTSQAALESSPSSQVPKRSSLSSQPGTGKRKSQRRKSNEQHQGSSQQEVGYSSNSPAPERRRQSRQQGTGRTRSRSPLKGRASNSPSQLRRPHGSRRSPASGAAGACTPLPGRGHPTIPRGLQTKDVQARDKASPPYKVRHQIPRASPEDAVAAELVRPKVLEAAPRALPDRWRRGPPGIPSCKNAEDVPVFCSKGRPKTEAVPHGIVGLPIPKDSREEATAAVPGSGGHLRHDATPGTSPEDAARAAMYQSHVPAPVPSSQANRVVTELSLDLCP